MLHKILWGLQSHWDSKYGDYEIRKTNLQNQHYKLMSHLASMAKNRLDILLFVRSDVLAVEKQGPPVRGMHLDPYYTVWSESIK